jgi:hypothetical protein
MFLYVLICFYMFLSYLYLFLSGFICCYLFLYGHLPLPPLPTPPSHPSHPCHHHKNPLHQYQAGIGPRINLGISEVNVGNHESTWLRLR